MPLAWVSHNHKVTRKLKYWTDILTTQKKMLRFISADDKVSEFRDELSHMM